MSDDPKFTRLDPHKPGDLPPTSAPALMNVLDHQLDDALRRSTTRAEHIRLTRMKATLSAIAKACTCPTREDPT
jgi:hypothetical protein